MANFEDAIGVVLRNEGGYVWDGNDPGGETNFGISKRSYPNVDIKNLTVEEAKFFYKRDFWKFDGINDQAVATKLLDAYVNMGRSAIKIAQEIAVAPVDGEYGPHTEALINAISPTAFLMQYRSGLAQHYQNIVANNPAMGKFLAGWLRRAAQ